MSKFDNCLSRAIDACHSILVELEGKRGRAASRKRAQVKRRLKRLERRIPC